MNFADKLLSRVTRTSPIVAGIDPNFDLMPRFLLPSSAKASHVTRSLFDFSRAVIDAFHSLLPAVKIQSAYYEQFGTPGIAALAESVAYAREKNLLVILDVKRGDIGATSTAYAKGYLAGYTELGSGLCLGSDLVADAITVNPFLGEDTLQTFVDLAIEYGKGLFILVKTSNPGSGMLQDRIVEGQSVSGHLARMVNRLGREESIGDMGYSSIGAVVGATYPQEAEQLRKLMPRAIHLVPGVGTQGGEIATTRANFDGKGLGAIIPISRALTYPRPVTENPDLSPAAYQEALVQAAGEYEAFARSAGYRDKGS